MLYIKYKASEFRGQHNERGWHIGTGRLHRIEGYPATDVESVQADGDELDYIARRWPNLLVRRAVDKKIVSVGTLRPINSDRVMTWRGETAQYIVSNLK